MLRDESDPGWHAVLQDRHTGNILAAGISHRDEIALRADLRYPWVPVNLIGNRGLPGHRHHVPRNAEPIDKPGILNCGIYLAHERERAETGFENARPLQENPADLIQERQLRRIRKCPLSKTEVL